MHVNRLCCRRVRLKFCSTVNGSSVGTEPMLFRIRTTDYIVTRLDNAYRFVGPRGAIYVTRRYAGRLRLMSEKKEHLRGVELSETDGVLRVL